MKLEIVKCDLWLDVGTDKGIEPAAIDKQVDATLTGAKAKLKAALTDVLSKEKDESNLCYGCSSCSTRYCYVS
jgi:hypothetical protein